MGAALWAGDGKATFRFEGEIKLVTTQAECDAACAHLSRYAQIGFDTENVAFVDGGGTNLTRAAIGTACGDGDVCYVFLFNKWSECFRSFASLMSAERPTKIANRISHDVTALQARFPARGSRGRPLLLNGSRELRNEVAHLQLRKTKLGYLIGEIFGEYLDKSIDHRWWEAPKLSSRQLEYAATDAWAHLRIAQTAAIMPAADGVAGVDDEEVSSQDEDDEAVPRAACYRHEGRPRAPNQAQLAAIDDEVDEANGGESDDDEPLDPDEHEDDDESGGVAHAPANPAASTAELLKAARRQIDDYFYSERSSTLELSSSFTSEQRKVLHAFVDRYGLHHRSVGVEGSSRRIVVQRWKPIAVMTAEIGADAVGALVAKEVGATVVRGRVEAFDAGATSWKLEYLDGDVQTVDIDELNLRLARRFQYDHGDDGRGEPGAQRPRADADGGDDADGAGDDHADNLMRGAPPVVGAYDETFLKQLIDAIDDKWAAGRIKYDIKHWMGNWSHMASADKNSLLFKAFMGYTSDAIFKMLPGEADRVREHMKGIGMSDADIRRVGRRYWRRRARYSCPDPETIIKGLYDVFCFFREMEDPERPGHKFFVNDADKIFQKEIVYVQEGLLSDPPEMNMYVRMRHCKRTGFAFFRSRRSTSALEGYHLHLRAAQHPCGKGAGPMLEVARSNLFDFAWNVKAAVAANRMVDHGHFALWLIDALADVCRGWLDEGHAQRPAALRSWHRTDTTIAPITVRGIDWAQLLRLKEQGAQAVELSPLQTTAELNRVLAHPQLVARGDAAGIARETGIVTSVKRLQKLAARIASVARARALLEAHGVQNLQNRVRATDGGLAPMDVVDAPQLEQPPERDDAAGPLPVDHVRLPAEEAEAVIEEPPEPEPEDEGNFDDNDDDGAWEGGEDAEDDEEAGGGGEDGEEDEDANAERRQRRGRQRPAADTIPDPPHWAPIESFGPPGKGTARDKEQRRRQEWRRRERAKRKAEAASTGAQRAASETAQRKRRKDARTGERAQARREREEEAPSEDEAGEPEQEAAGLLQRLFTRRGRR